MTFLAQEALGVGFEPLFFFYEAMGDVSQRAFDILMMITFVFAFAGLLNAAFKTIMGGDLLEVFRQLILTAIIVAIIPLSPNWILSAQATLGVDLLVALEVDPWSVIERAVLESIEFIDFSVDVTANIFGIFDPVEIYETIMRLVGSFVMLCISVITFALMYLAFQIQIIAIYMAIAAVPIFLGMLLFEQTRETGIKYLMGILGICFWPLGWGLGLIFAEAFIDAGEDIFAAIPFLAALAVLNTYTYLIVLLVAFAWIIMTVFIAPKVVNKAITTGTQIGLGMVGGAIGVGTAGVTAAVAAATAAASAAAGVAATVATGGAAAPVAAAGAAAGVGAAGALAGGAAAGAGGLAKGMTDE